ncbi:MAG: ATP-binding protein [Solirubrobacteraceae bacterium]|nr:ATP-binding protein [Solirubrobacteraceae bacterium]
MLALAYVLVLAVVSLIVPLGISLRDRVDAEIRLEARAEAQVVASRAVSLLNPPRSGRLGTLSESAAKAAGGRVLIVDRSGEVLADSEDSVAVGSSFASRTEIASALKGKATQERRYSSTLNAEILATAVPIYTGAAIKPVGAVRVTQSVNAVNRAIRRTWLGLLLLGLVVIALGLTAGAIIAGRITRPIVRLDRAAGQVAQGDLTVVAELEGSREQRALAASFNAMTERVNVLLDGQREFVADASHQMRTPLTGMRLRLEEARAQSEDPQQREELDEAIGEVDRLTLIVAQLLELSQAGEAPPPKSTADSAEALAAALTRWAGPAAEAGCDLRLDASASCQIACHSSDVDRILDTLIENAIAYAPGTEIVLSSAGSTLRVGDRGPGLAGESGESLFERFHRGAAGRGGPPGTGLGLSIVRELARRWGGDATIIDREGGGAEVAVSFPQAMPTSLPNLSQDESKLG